MKALIFILIPILIPFGKADLTADEIIRKVDDNMSSNTRITESQMVIYGRRNSRTVTSIGYAEGYTKSFTEYLAPEREKGTKMLKLDDKLWIYSPSTDRIIQLSGHMLKQSVMGSDLSYEDMMEDRKLLEMYDSKIVGEEMLDDRKVWVIELDAKVNDASYDAQKLWIDQERFVPLQQDMFAKSGKLLKRVKMDDIKRLDGRWYPTKMNYKDMLKDGKGTDFIVVDLKFDPDIPDHIFNKSSLKR